MSDSAVAIVGSGIVGTTIAYRLTQQGHDVVIVEKGPVYPYPHSAQFREQILHMHDNPNYALPGDLQNLSVSGGYPQDDLNHERGMVTGGSATHWGAITLRMPPETFKTKSLYGYGMDWPLTYDDLEPYYGEAEALLGVSGTDNDNPFAPRRSRPYPLPPFELSYDDIRLAERLRRHGIVLHTTPQARTRNPYDGRPGCQNFGTCEVCPIGARYSPNHHLQKALATGLCRLYPNTSVRRIVLERSGQAKALVYRGNDAQVDVEHNAKVIIVAAGTLESARLLLMSRDDRSDGIGNSGGLVGKYLTFHHLWSGRIHYKDAMSPGILGPYTGRSDQFLDPPGRGRLGGAMVGFSSNLPDYPWGQVEGWRTGPEVVAALKEMRHRRMILLTGESVPRSQNAVTLSSARDRFGDPYAHVHYELTDFDHETYRFARTLFQRFIAATSGDSAGFDNIESFWSGAHHMGTCRMGADARDSVVDQFGKVHGTANLFVVGGSNFLSPGAVNPTLTMVALAIRTSDYILRNLL